MANRAPAHPATARQRQQARGRQQPLDVVQFVTPPDETGRLDRQFRSPSLRGGGLHARPPYTPADLLGSGSSNAGSMLRNGASGTLVLHCANEFKADAGEVRGADALDSARTWTADSGLVRREPRTGRWPRSKGFWIISSPRSVTPGSRRSTRKRPISSADDDAQTGVRGQRDPGVP